MKLFIFSLFVFLLLGCGQKGALQRPADVASTVPSPPSTSENNKDEDDIERINSKKSD